MKHAIVIAIILAGIMTITSFSSRNLTFTSRGCLLDIQPYSGPRAEVLSFKKEGSIMLAKGCVKTYCGGQK